MATKKLPVKDKRPSPLFRPSGEDREILECLGKKYGGLNFTSVIKLAIRALAEQKGVAA